MKYVLLTFLISFYISGAFSQERYLHFTHLTVENGLPQNTIHGILKDKYGFMWFGTWAGLCRYDGYTMRTYRNEEDNTKTLNSSRIHNIYKDTGDTIWVETFDGSEICRYNYELDNFDRLPRKMVRCNILDSLNRRKSYSRNHASSSMYRWNVNTTNNLLYQISLNDRSEFIYHVDPFYKWSISDDYVTDIYLDNNQILWVGTFSGGINMVNTRAKPFIYYSTLVNTNQCIVDDNIRALCVDNLGFLWVGTRSKGITRIDRKNNRFEHFRTIGKNSLVNNQIRKIYCDGNGNIWIGTKGGVTKYNSMTKRFSSYTIKSKKPLPHNWIYWIMEDHSRVLWIGTFKGIAKYNTRGDYFETVNPENRLTNVKVIIEDKRFNLWIGTEGEGLFCLKRCIRNRKEEFVISNAYKYSATNANSLSNNRIFAMHLDNHGIFWVGTAGGLNRFNPDSSTFKRFTEKTGFVDNMVLGLLSDRNDNLWVSHTKGLTRFNTRNFTQRNFTSKDGLQSNEFCENAYFRNPVTGEMFFGGINGLNSFFPDSIKDDPYNARVVLTELRINNQPVHSNDEINKRVVLKKQLFLTDEITLHHSDKSISIEFAALHYANPGGNRYQYMLEGFDKKWIETIAQKRSASYSSLSPGKYVFKVMGSNSDGIWNPEQTRLTIYVVPPWWKSPMAYVVYFLVFVAILYLIIRYVITRERYKHQLHLNKLEAEKIHELDHQKLEFFTKISHEIRTPLSLIVGPVEELTKEKVDINTPKFNFYTKLLKRNTDHLLSLVNQLLDFRKNDSGYLKLDVTQHNIVEFTKEIYEDFQCLAIQRNIQYSFQAKVNELMVWFDVDKLNKILYNLLHNAFKYTNDGGEISISLKATKKNETSYVLIAISDSGIGIPEEHHEKVFSPFYQVQTDSRTGIGLGLSLVKELTLLHHGMIELESVSGKGSCFNVYLPLHGNEITAESYANHTKTSGLNTPQPNVIQKFDNEEVNGNSELSLLQIIEDNEDLSNFIAVELGQDFNIIESANGRSGIEMASETLPDLIISDIMMPEMDGLELCKKLKTDERTSHIPIILLTAKHSDEYKIEGYETGADDYITKPFSTAVLKTRIKNLINNRRKLRELFGQETKPDLKLSAMNSVDKNFMVKAMQIIEENMDSETFDVEFLASKLNMSRVQLYRKIKALTNQTVHDYITTIRLNKAAELLLSGEHSISEVAYQVGYSLPNNFSRTFTRHFGQTPSDYILNYRKNLKDS